MFMNQHATWPWKSGMASLTLWHTMTVFEAWLTVHDVLVWCNKEKGYATHMGINGKIKLHENCTLYLINIKIYHIWAFSGA